MSKLLVDNPLMITSVTGRKKLSFCISRSSMAGMSPCYLHGVWAKLV